MTTLSFDNVFNEYNRQLKNFLSTRISNKHDIEDILQETFFRVWKGIDSFEGRSSLWTWLCQIAINVKNSYYNPFRMRDLEELDIEEAECYDSPENVLICEQATTTIEENYASLSVEHKNAWNARMNDEIPRELAVKWNVPYQTAVTRLAKSKQLMMKGLI